MSFKRKSIIKIVIFQIYSKLKFTYCTYKWNIHAVEYDPHLSSLNFIAFCQNSSDRYITLNVIFFSINYIVKNLRN